MIYQHGQLIAVLTQVNGQLLAMRGTLVALNGQMAVHSAVTQTTTKALQAHNAQLALGMGRMGGSLAIINKVSICNKRIFKCITDSRWCYKNFGLWLLAGIKSLGLLLARFTLVGGVITIITLLGAALYGWMFKIKQVDEVQKQLNKTNQEAERIYAKESHQLNILSKSATDEYSTKEMRAQAVKRLNDLAPAYLGNLNEENVRTEEGIALINLYNESLERKQKLKRMQILWLNLKKIV